MRRPRWPEVGLGQLLSHPQGGTQSGAVSARFQREAGCTALAAPCVLEALSELCLGRNVHFTRLAGGFAGSRFNRTPQPAQRRTKTKLIYLVIVYKPL